MLLAWADDFAYVGWITLTLLGVLALLRAWICGLGAIKFGASPGRVVTGAVLGRSLPLRMPRVQGGMLKKAEKVGILYNYRHRHLQAKFSRLE